MREMQCLNAGNTIAAYRDKLMQMHDAQVSKALAQLEKTQCPETVLKQLAWELVNKIMHEPSAQLRQAALDGQWDMLALARRLFGI